MDPSLDRQTTLRAQANGVVEKPMVEIRLGRLEDAHGVAELGSSQFAATFGHSLEPQDLEEYLSQSYNLDKIKAEISNPIIHFVVAVSNETIVGFAQLTEGTSEDCIANLEKTVELQRLYVHKSQQGSGLAKKLGERIQSIARDREYKVMWLGVWEENIRAQKFYQKLGFARVGEHDFVTGTCVQTDWIMSKDL